MFKDSMNVYKMFFEQAREFVNKNRSRYPEVLQTKHEQDNDTWGLLVPKELLRRNLKVFKKETLS